MLTTRPIGSLNVSVVGLGCGSMGHDFGARIDEAQSRAVIWAALDAGITFFDTSDSYGESEEYLGRALSKHNGEIIIATKFGEQRDGLPPASGGKASWIYKAVEASLRRLQRDTIDLYQMHYPDPKTPIEETLAALNNLIVSGKVREIGCSNFTLTALQSAADSANAQELRSFASCQDELNLLRSANLADRVPLCDRLGMAFLPYFPLANGLLTGKYSKEGPLDASGRLGRLVQQVSQRQIPPDRLATLAPELQSEQLPDSLHSHISRLRDYAGARGRSLMELAIGWLLSSSENVASVIAGATKPQQVHQNASSAGWMLTASECADVATLISSYQAAAAV